MRILVIFILTLLHYGESQLCLSALRGWQGTLYYPQMRDNQKNRQFFTKGENMKDNCVFYLNSGYASEIKLTIGMIKIGNDANVLIKAFTQSTKTWNVFHSVTGNIPTWIDLTAINVAYLKIVVPKSSGSFFVDYKMNSCPELPTSMKMLACTKDRYFGSHCVTECSDDYYSRNINENKFHARCGRKMVKGKMEYFWVYTPPGTDKVCVSKDVVEETCFNETSNPTCPFRMNDLLLLLGERYDIPEKEERPINPFGAGSRSLLLGAPPSVARYVSQLFINTCKKKFCGIDSETKDYIPVCAAMKWPRPKRVCIRCRHSKMKPCESSTVVLGA